MSLRENLEKPLVIEPKAGHTHTVIFLHRYPVDTRDEDLSTKVLSSKKPGWFMTLHDKFPTVRWVFPHPKLHSKTQKGQPRYYEDLSPSDVAKLGLLDNGVPYITQIILHEARYVGALDKVIIGGQGETAVAAHAAINRFPEIPFAARNDAAATEAFIRQTFPGNWTGASDFKLAGFVGMHAIDDEGSQDQRTSLLVSKWPNDKTIKDNLILNTPHKFIHGGTKVDHEPGDGARIQQFSDFLASLGVFYKGMEMETQTLTLSAEPEKVVPRFTKANEPTTEDIAKAQKEREIAEREKYLAQVKKQKREAEAVRERTLKRIEDDKIERRLRQQRERAKLFPTGDEGILPDECQETGPWRRGAHNDRYGRSSQSRSPSFDGDYDEQPRKWHHGSGRVLGGEPVKTKPEREEAESPTIKDEH
ncbi:hypothetical protein PFICI_12790 [Pestalotiopsis fici W106-1]|uniref:Phospholipase/carboxylesterase/thioesterase domain-containing protein n=1 Tax=Pestalotiopsis fici (strain W106-1 / CGMCC3.15140) TaxID=1229662 RepID=W3WSP4_PESFW|nr:uncharacterized protein PFICI_12790 [Pestalotiopsis fici W106-1]ETS75846.1 hypothetical protein PFICI_12790 [Pestalotiopsis fici W106-1]